MDISFKEWFNEYADFGLDMGRQMSKPKLPPKEGPMMRLNIEYVCKDLMTQTLGKRKPKDLYFGEIVWGDGPGALKVFFTPYGGTRVILRKLTKDLKGESRWICKRVLELGNFYDEKADTLIVKLMDNLKEMDQGDIEAPSNTFEGLERFVLHLANGIRRYTTERILMYEGIRRIEENKHYIIHFGCTGMGVQRQDQKRLDQLQIEVKYDLEGGFIKIALNELGDKIKSHRWQLDPSEFVEYYMPTQNQDEIIGTVVSLINSY